MDDSNENSPDGKWLQSICQLWEKQATAAKASKERDFDKSARRAWSFLGKNYKELYVDDSPESQPFRMATPPDYMARLNKSREFIQLYVPYLHPKDNVFSVTSQQEPLPPELEGIITENKSNSKLREWLLQWRLNYILKESDLLLDSRMVLQEALVKGRGVVWHEAVETPYGDVFYPVFDSVDNLLIDPDCRTYRDAAFIIRIRHRSKWRIAEEFEIPVEDLPSNQKSNLQQSIDLVGGNSDPALDDRGDVVHYLEIWSRMGIGHKSFLAGDDLKDIKDELDALGDACFLCVCPGVKYPLNLHPSKLLGPNRAQNIEERCKWPCELWADHSDPWPCTPCDFIPNVDNPHATSSLEAAAPLQAILDHMTSFLMTKIRATSCDAILTSKAIGEELRSWIENPSDHKVIDTDEAPGETKKLAEVFQFPEIKKEFIQLYELFNREFEKSTGMDPLMYGAGGASAARSATESRYRESHVASRPEDYAGIVRQWLATIGRKTAICSRLYDTPQMIGAMTGEDVQMIVGDNGEQREAYSSLIEAWMKDVHTDDPYDAAAEFDYTLRSGKPPSAEPGRISDILLQFVQNNQAAMLQQAQEGGDPRPYNALIRVLNVLTDGLLPVDQLLLKPQPPAGQAEAQAQAEAAAQEQQMAAQQQQQKQQLDLEKARQDLAVQAEKTRQELAMQSERHKQEMKFKEESHKQDMRIKEAQVRAASRQQQSKPAKAGK